MTKEPLMEQINTPTTTPPSPPAKSFMTAGPTLHYSHTNVLLFWFLTVVVFIIACAFWYAIVTGGPISIDFSEFEEGSLFSLGRYVTEPISIYEYPAYIVVLGILMGILAVGPVLVSQLLSFRYSIPLILSLVFIAKLYVFGLMVLISCIAVACRPLRFRSRIVSVALCMAPQLVYWAVWGGNPTPDAVLWALSYAPWISAWFNSLIMAALILGIGHYTRYKPGLNWLTYLLFLGIAFSVFQRYIGFAELDYQRRVLDNSLEDIPEFGDYSLSSTLDQIISDPSLRSKLEGRFYPTHNPEEFRRALTEDIRESLRLNNRWPEWFRRKMPEKFEYQIKRQKLMIECQEFIDRWSNNPKRMPAALYLRAMLSELHPDLRDVCSDEILRFFDDYPFQSNIFNWLELYDQFSQSPESFEARWRIAMYEAGKGNFDKANEFCQVALTLLDEEMKRQRLSETPNPGSVSAAFQKPKLTVMTPFKLQNLKTRLLKLQILIGTENLGPDEQSHRRLSEFAMLNPYDLNYESRLDSLLERLDKKDRLRDNVLLEKALLVDDENLRLQLLADLMDKYSGKDGAIQAQYETGQTKIQIWKNMTGPEDVKKQLLTEVWSILSDLIAQYPDSLYSQQAQTLLQSLPKAQ